MAVAPKQIHPSSRPAKPESQPQSTLLKTKGSGPLVLISSDQRGRILARFGAVPPGAREEFGVVPDTILAAEGFPGDGYGQPGETRYCNSIRLHMQITSSVR